MTPPTEQAGCREEFEANWRKRLGFLDDTTPQSWPNGTYYDHETQAEWIGFSAAWSARSSRVEELERQIVELEMRLGATMESDL